jgi:hypothetical protein
MLPLTLAARSPEYAMGAKMLLPLFSFERYSFTAATPRHFEMRVQMLFRSTNS